jgi:DNA-binding CsgD family transcriptional regulator
LRLGAAGVMMVIRMGRRESTRTAVSEDVLVERAGELVRLDGILREVQTGGRGRLVLISGEAGIGKSALARAFCARWPAVRALWGGCDALATPRALGPFVDIARAAGGELAAVLEKAPTAAGVAAALIEEVDREFAVVVLEDLHWSDEATLDALRLLTRRIESTGMLLVVTHRDDELHRSHPLRVALGDLTVRSVHRLGLSGLSRAGVEQLTAASGVDAVELHLRTAGNPFFVTEVLAAGPGAVPDTVRDAVLARAARLNEDARAVLDAVAIEPDRAELWLLEALVGDASSGLDVCLDTGMLRAERHAVRFRHEIARVTVEEALAPYRRMLLHRRALGALTAAIGRRPDLARLAFHAEAADDPDAVLRFAPAAGERAAALGSHREAAAQFARALRYADDLEPARRAELLERRSFECYLTDDMPGAIEARRLAIEDHRAANNTLGEGNAHRWLSRLAWFSGDNATAEDEARVAIDLLQPLGPISELAMAYSNMSQLGMLSSDEERAIAWGRRAIDLAEQLHEREILVHALNNVGTVELMAGLPAGREKLERSLALALVDNLHEHVARAYTNLSCIFVDIHDHGSAERWLGDGIGYCRERDLDSWSSYMTGYRALLRLDQGRWEEAAASASLVLSRSDVGTSQLVPLVVIGQLRARRGDPDPWSPLDQASRAADGTGELQRLGPTAIARAEAHWLAGDVDAIEEETGAALALALERRDSWQAGALAVWRRRAGIVEEIASDGLGEPWRLELEGQAEQAAEAWTALGCPFEAALAAAHADSEDYRRRGLAELQALGARPAATRVARILRAGGVRKLSRGPRASTRHNPGGLTERELEVLTLVAQGLQDSEIAARLFMSNRTAGHHVAAILRKLDARTRSQAAAAAARLGITER